MGILNQDIDKQLEGLKKSVQDKLGKDPAEVDAAFKKAMEKYSDKPEEVAKNKAYADVRREYASSLRSPAKTYTGIVLGASDPFDMIRGMREEAAVMWKQDKDAAIKGGICDEHGAPLDTRATFGTGRQNENFGKPLEEHEYIQNVVGVLFDEEGDMKLFMMSLGNNLAKKVAIPTYTPVKFRANPRKTQNRDGFFMVNPYSKIEFIPLTDEELAEAEFPDLDTILGSEQLDGRVVTLDQLEEWHEDNKDDYQRFVIGVGVVGYIADGANEKTGNILMVIEDGTIAIDAPGVTCWIPEHLHDVADFGQGSRVVVTASTHKSNYQDEERMMLNLWGLYAIPEYREEKDENPRQAVEKVE